MALMFNLSKQCPTVLNLNFVHYYNNTTGEITSLYLTYIKFN